MNVVKELDNSTSGRRRKVLPLLLRLLLGEKDDSARVPIALELMHGTAKQMLATIKGLYGYLIQLPPRKSLEDIRDNLRMQFMRTWGLRNLPNGMRVSLVNAVTYVAKESYGLDKLEGARVDIWGDSMVRGKQEIVRLCFRFLGCPNRQIQFKSQSRMETITFAVFCGKDSWINMERNLTSFDVVGKRGWLYNETKHLVDDLKVHLTISGDTPWLSKLVLGFGHDCQVLSSVAIWYPNPPEVEIEAVCDKHKISRKDLEKTEHSNQLQADLLEIDCVLPQIARNGYRTQIQTSINIPLPTTAFIYLPDRSFICQDGFHSSVRIMEKDIKLISEYLLEKGRLDHFKSLESNINRHKFILFIHLMQFGIHIMQYY